MLKNAMKSTSVLAICTALMVPPALAQDTSTEQLETCTVSGPFPCVTEEGKRIKNAKQLAKAMLLGDEAAAEAEADASAEVATTPAEPAEPATPATPAEPGGVAADAEVTTEAEVETPVAEADVTTDTAAEVEAEAPEEKSIVQDLADKLTGDDAPAAEAEATAAEEAAVEEDAAPAEEEMTAGERIEADTSAETAQAPETEAPAEEDKGLIETLTDRLTGNDEAAPAEEAAPEDVTQSQTIPETPVEDEAPEAAAAAEADVDVTDEDMAADADVVVEEVTTEEARSSSEEFDTKVAAGRKNNGNNTNANAEAQAGTGLNRQLTDFEKLLIVGLGGVAVGTVLANGDKIMSNSGDRVVVQNPDGTLSVLKNDDVILRQPGTVVSTKSFDDGSTRTVIERQNGVRIVTVRANDGTVLKRVRVLPDGTRIVLFDDTQTSAPVSNADVASYTPAPSTNLSSSDQDALREALMASMNNQADRTFSLRQIRMYPQIRALAPEIEVDAITFNTGSAVITSAQAEELAALGLAIRDVISQVPDAVFLIEGHTDSVGDASYNLALSDRRAESVALALTEYFEVPPENLITQGYGESELKIAAQGDIRENRRANVRNITPLLQ